MQKVAIIGGRRTPFAKAGTSFAKLSTLDLAISNVESTIASLNLKPSEIDELVYGTVLLNPRVPNLAREIVLRSSLPKDLSAHFVSNNCITGILAASTLADSIRAGRVGLGLAGGAESMSRPALTLSSAAESFYLDLNRARNFQERLSHLIKWKLGYMFPAAPSPKEPSTGLTMGQHCEITTKEFGIPREVQDALALRSHHAAAAAKSAGKLSDEIVPFAGLDHDNLVRANTSAEKLASLTPVFDRTGAGTLTAGNSSALTDGASCVCLASEQRAKELGLSPLAYIEDIQFAAINPTDGLLMAPAIAMNKLFQKNFLKIYDVDLFEVHEAFSAQVLANMHVWEKGWSKFPELRALGAIPGEKLNVNGGSLAIGHPFAATGGRLIINLVNEMQKRNLQTGVISVCAAGAMAAAVLIKRY